MSEAKIEVKIGEFSFSGSGDQNWLTHQLDKILEKAADMKQLAQSFSKAEVSDAPESNNGKGQKNNVKPLATYLKEKNAAVKQVEKFLATALWLEEKHGKDRLKTSDISSALKTANQNKLGNPADCLNQNVSKGFCEKEGDGFFVTQEGRDALGMSA